MGYQTQASSTKAKTGVPRWQRIMALPAHYPMYDISTGINYKREQFRPLFMDHAQSTVETFLILGTNKTVSVGTLRLLSDKTSCSLMQADNNPMAHYWAHLDPHQGAGV